MRIRPEFIATNVAASTVLVPTGEANFRGVVRGNKTFAAIVELLSEDTTEEEIVEAMSTRFDAPKSVIEADVSHALAQLRTIDALEE